ncbi:MAG: SDR family NAD(P)-dependent oxidoreductase [Alphaproteobacteria bacterium]|nr:SDR family NAD(P)-dependent oxidoreductase [Alphaproteobacteria bacterium]
MIESRNAIVTGSTRGIGEAIARALATDGCNVMMNGFGDADEIERKRASIEADTGATVKFHGADLSDENQLDDLTSSAVDAFGSVDILVNNAVIRYFHDIENFDRKDWNHALAVNVTAPFLLSQNVLPGMRAQGWGRIVNFSSVLGLAARSGRADYVTSKTAMLGLTRAVAAETRSEKNITCNALCPGSVLTPNTEMKIAELADETGLSADEAKDEYLRRRGQTTGYIEPARVAGLVTFLCQDAASDITGAAIPIDRGRSATWLDGAGE